MHAKMSYVHVLCLFVFSFRFDVMAVLSEAINTFTLNVFKEISEKDSSQNVFYSPLSLYCALAMVLEGAKGNTAAQIQQVLGTKRKQINKKANHMKYCTSPKSHLKGAELCQQCSHRELGSFKESCQKFYHSNVEELDFANASEEARKYINKWTEEKTEDLIQELLSNDSINPWTSLVLVNAIYFKGKWEKKFDKNRTREEMFKISKQKPVQMMFLKSRFRMRHIEDVSTQVLVLPYVGGQMDMVIFLPDENTDLKMLEQGLTPEKLTDWLKPERMKMTEVGVYLPRFKLEENLDMENILQKLGMSDAFDMSKADFSGISAGKDLFLSKVSHKAFVEVNEESTEAAAATVVGLRGSCLCSFFVVDHPFLFLIRDNSSKTILFWGKVISP
ncbi:serpin B6-like [Sarcophilus harrisii]|uniref:serpin B6-like n=1 Tax=Sarcophilus harrisii TaxID=9305 RepID=UPI001301D636|nr:serpin B6-like [Sarcophilus harrisii]